MRYRNNDYSVPTRYGHQEVLAKGYVNRVEIACRGETVAVHVRSYGKADFIYNEPLHYRMRPTKAAVERGWSVRVGYAAFASAVANWRAFQFHGSSSSMRFAGWSGR